MSGLETLGLVANIFQVINFSAETIRICKAFYDGASPEQGLGDYATTLQNLSLQIELYCQQRKSNGATERELDNMARKCSVVARALQEEVQYITMPGTKRTGVVAIRATVRTLWRRGRLHRLKGDLKTYQETMESHLLFRVCTQNDALQAQQQTEFEAMDKSVQYFIKQYGEGHRTLYDLVESKFQSTENCITESARDVEKHITKEVSAAQTALEKLTMERFDQMNQNLVESSKMPQVDDDRRKRFLRSLKFSSLNERFNSITDSHQSTFGWIFGDTEMATGSMDRDRLLQRSGTRNDNSDLDRPWDDIQEWLQSESNTYWISGKPGSGKSTLMKFLLSTSRTREALALWRESPRILSHFFWRPGTAMQRSVKGLLCTLLHQAISQEPSVLARFLTPTDTVEAKDFDSDWSVSELKLVLRNTLLDYPSAVCIFLDGLDEIDQQDLPMLLKFIDDLKKLPLVKVCSASRPEIMFYDHFRGAQQMRLQDLTWNDMRIYADSVLNRQGESDPHLPLGEPVARNFPMETIDSLAWKAQGVFLWLHLVTGSLIRGWASGDTKEEIQNRISALPEKLTELYLDMWGRPGDDNVIYRETAAEVFNLILAARNLKSNFELNVVQYMAITVESFYGDVLGPTENRPSVGDIASLCQKVVASLRKKCFGLVEVWTKEPRDEGTDSVDYHLDSRVAFVHRTAYDFLTGSKEGEKILSYDLTSPKARYLRLAKGALASYICKPKKCPPQRMDWQFYGQEIFLKALAHALSQGLEEDITQVLSDSHDLWCAGRFLGEVPVLTHAMVERLGQIALAVIRRDPSPKYLATRVLKTLFNDVTDIGVVGSDYQGLIRDGYIVQSLISIGASPISLDRGLDGGLVPRSDDRQTTITTFALAVIFILQQRGIQSRDHFESYVKCVEHFREYRADGEERVFFGIHVDDPEVKLYHTSFFSSSRGVTFRFEVPLAYLIELVVAHLATEGLDAEPFMGPRRPIPCDIPGRLRIQRFLVKGYREGFQSRSEFIRAPSESAMETLSCINSLAIFWLEADISRRPEIEKELRTMTDDLLKQFPTTESRYTSIFSMARRMYLPEECEEGTMEALSLEQPHHFDFTVCSDENEGDQSQYRSSLPALEEEMGPTPTPEGVGTTIPTRINDGLQLDTVLKMGYD